MVVGGVGCCESPGGIGLSRFLRPNSYGFLMNGLVLGDIILQLYL